MFCDIYVTDYGEVRISPDEAEICRKAYIIRASGASASGTLTGANILAKEAMLRIACERVAKHRLGLK